MSEDIGESARTVNVAAQHRYDKPGTYFVALKGVSQCQGDMDTPYARLETSVGCGLS